MTEVVVVGGGIAGTTIAWELARRGVAVTLFEQGSLAAGASGRNTGTLLHQTEPAVAAMFSASLDGYRSIGFEWTPREELLLARTPSQVSLAAAKAAVIGGATAVSGDELRSAYPAFGPSVLGGQVFTGAGTVEPEDATRAFAEAARSAGARVRTGVRVGRVASDGVLTDEGPVACDAVVVAAGPWLADLVRVPVKAGRGWLMQAERLDVPWIVEEVSWPDQVVLGQAAEPTPIADVASGRVDVPIGECALLCPRPGGDGLLGASLSTSLRDAVEGVDAPRRIAARVLEVAPGLRTRIVRAWWGLRPMTPDGLPVAGSWDGVWVHGGHGSLGMQAAPATAAWLAAAMHGSDTPPTFSELTPERFT
ncbi:NAD(P)/FAD-dependent oxidoreductase [Solirubrobacter soli]|uniref:NAD(P)/FAD-dependent oxidoreductase n=1 Tax=Solirubrobacter soli TaxID=363832 RepID=UPI000427C45F|nr:FAD-dependent oxidoreductase [Solirubrobacter soli]